MNPYPTQPNDALNLNLDRILTALREAPAPTGMNQRIAARLAQAQAQPIMSPTATRRWQLIAGHLTPTYRYAFTVIALLAISVLVFQHKAQPLTQLNTTHSPLHIPTTRPATHDTLSATPRPSDNRLSQSFSPSDNRLSQSFSPAGNRLSESFSPAGNRVPQGFSLGSHRLPEDSGVLTPDAIALAETLAPNRPIPPMPLTAEEHLFVLATRQGQPMEVAELETLRQPALEARAEAREQATIRSYVHSLLAPLAVAEAINPTPSDDAPASPPPSK